MDSVAIVLVQTHLGCDGHPFVVVVHAVPVKDLRQGPVDVEELLVVPGTRKENLRLAHPPLARAVEKVLGALVRRALPLVPILGQVARMDRCTELGRQVYVANVLKGLPVGAAGDAEVVECIVAENHVEKDEKALVRVDEDAHAVPTHACDVCVEKQF